MKKISLLAMVCMATSSLFAQKTEPLNASKTVAPRALSTPISAEAKVKAANVTSEAAAVNSDEKLKAAEVVVPVASVNADYKAAPVKANTEVAPNAPLALKKAVPEQSIKEPVKKGKE